MLKAFDTIETEWMNTGIMDERLFAEERRLALDFVYSNPVAATATICPVCGTQHPEHFMQIAYTVYLRCNACGSIFVPVDSNTINRYKAHEPLVALRRSAEYQHSATEKRQHMWNDLVFWLRFRCARYLGAAENLAVSLYGSHHQGLADTICESGLCGNFQLEASILSPGGATQNMPPKNIAQAGETTGADVLLYLDQLAREAEPTAVLQNLRQRIHPGGLFILSTRVGSGIDLLTLKGNIKNLFPYEHSLLPSTKGLKILLQQAGFALLEIQTPGTLDVKYLRDNLAGMGNDNLYLQHLLKTADKSTLAEFQYFLQKSGTSSHARVVARKEGE